MKVVGELIVEDSGATCSTQVDQKFLTRVVPGHSSSLDVDSELLHARVRQLVERLWGDQRTHVPSSRSRPKSPNLLARPVLRDIRNCPVAGEPRYRTEEPAPAL